MYVCREIQNTGMDWICSKNQDTCSLSGQLDEYEGVRQ